MTRPERPRSPNIQIYRPQITSVLSITHRLTGLVLSVGAVLLVIWLVAAAAGPEVYAGVQGFLGSWLGTVLLFVWTFAFFFHLANGIRHLFWDAGYGFTLEAIYASGWTVVAASILLTVAAWIASAFMAGPG